MITGAVILFVGITIGWYARYSKAYRLATVLMNQSKREIMKKYFANEKQAIIVNMDETNPLDII